ncbi:T9SS type A sorting domain-containing protein [Flavobacterium sp. LaA7.5]|nr:T9SS type A sorting domain-containing protein [Flavobacterium salilacus subsp. altitudinum]
MKKKLLYLTLLLLSLTTNAQTYFEGFEDAGVFPPPGWMVLDNGIGPAVQWIQEANPVVSAYDGIYAAYVGRENVSTGIPEDWLVTPQMMGADRVRFFSRLTIGGDQGSIYRVMITNGDPIDIGAYSVLQEWTELEINPEQTTYTEKVVDVPSEYLGQQIHFAFVMIADNGDRWLIDNVSFEVDCVPPTNIEVDFEGATATASWEAEEGVDQWEVYIMPGYQTFVGDEEGIVVSGEPSYTFNGLVEDELYKVYVRTICSDDNIGWWTGPVYTETIFNNNTVTGTLMYDNNGDNNCDEANYIPSIPILVNINGDFIFYTYTNAEGQYTLHNIPEGQNTITLQPLLPQGFDDAPVVSEILTFEGTDIEHVLDVCVPQYDEAINDIEVTFLPINAAQPGFYPRYSLKVRNNSILLAENITVTLDFDATRVQVNTVGNTYTVTDENTIVINIGDIPAFGSNISEVKFYAFEPPVNEAGDQLLYTAYAEMDATEDNPTNNYYTLNQTLVNSYDPNSVVVAEGSMIELEDEIKYVHYTINFQNLGTAPAVNIKIENDLDANFDSDTFEMIASSHNFTVARTGEHLEFQFPNINLASSLVDEPNSHGYAIYKVKPITTIQEGDIVNNTADIYFDFNSAIVTNTATSEFYSVLMGTDEREVNTVLIYPNPVNNILYINTKADEVLSVTVYDLNGRNCLVAEGTAINVEALKAGLYFVNITTESGNATCKLIKQ